MGQARICKCGHVTVDHHYQFGKDVTYGACEWDGCECKQYTFDYQIASKGSRFHDGVKPKQYQCNNGEYA